MHLHLLARPDDANGYLELNIEVYVRVIVGMMVVLCVHDTHTCDRTIHMIHSVFTLHAL